MGFIINPYAFGVAGDADANAFITAAGITDSTQKSAIQTLVTDLKGYGIWTKMKALYPFVGGTATTHKYNLKDPQDTDGAFRLVFSGGWTHSSTGALPNGTNGWADTFVNSQDNLSLNSIHFSGYSRTNSTNDSIFIGNVWGGASYENTLWIRYSGNLSYIRVNTSNLSSLSNSDSRGLFIANRASSTVQSITIRGTRTDFNVNSGTTTNTRNFNLSSALDQNTPGSRGFYDSKEYAFASIGDGLTNQNLTDLNTAVVAFQTTLGRNV